MNYRLALVCGALLCLATVSIPAQTPTAKIIPLGQLDGPRLREIAGAFCGPFFTMTPIDANGGGFLHLAVSSSPPEITIVTFPVKAIHVRWCESCDAPTFAQSGDDASVRAQLSISREQWKASPCLRSAKVEKR